MEMAGLQMWDFASQEEAFATAADLVNQSAEEYGFVPETIEHENPFLVRCYYMESKGQERVVSNGTVKKIYANAAVNKAKLADFKEITGGRSSLDSTDLCIIKTEHPDYTKMKVAYDVLKSFLFSCDFNLHEIALGLKHTH